MTIDKKINYEEGSEKARFIAQLRARYEKAKREGKFKGDNKEFLLKEKQEDILNRSQFSKGGKPNGVTTWSLDDWLETVDPGGWASEEDKPVKKASLGDVEQDLANEYWEDQYHIYLDGGGLYMDFKDFMKWQLSSAENEGKNEGIVSVLKL